MTELETWVRATILEESAYLAPAQMISYYYIWIYSWLCKLVSPQNQKKATPVGGSYMAGFFFLRPCRHASHDWLWTAYLQMVSSIVHDIELGSCEFT